ncbi:MULTISPECIES: DUF3144 domain-containing protein [Shewanella]|uniref:DUF3144 domain-containing protein n=1 Tax=Shewanella japonica TaxID=93973 RepID=A0ABM6JHK1_9GAMM|nr:MULTISPECIES: DUF3144 domain-containing protein [Shewanella]ARD21422.1 hypothetical protein SJ2017_1091 [Shewanella japonica]KPZ71150.1 hypothetical protein AN944_01892 [Shewanella sp. P1-14-1]MBQ4888779.1 DUF3144 domain-containing protein [Shewanella sp. MMG014]OBT08895.1 hypothetical protein A9267_07620 [Shewanella sp. UCD-FRSSP16_17]
MSEQKTETTMYQLADQFIALANQLGQTENDIGKVGTALRFAAARYNAFEAAIKSANLEAEKENALSWFTEEYKGMLNENLNDHIKNPPGGQQEAKEEKADDSVQVFKN